MKGDLRGMRGGDLHDGERDQVNGGGGGGGKGKDLHSDRAEALLCLLCQTPKRKSVDITCIFI